MNVPTALLRTRLHNGKSLGERTLARRQTPSLAYVPEPTHRSRAAIIEERKHFNKPHASYDIDGDGVVRCVVGWCWQAV